MQLCTATHGVKTNFRGNDNNHEILLSLHIGSVNEILFAYAKDNAKTLHGTSSYSLCYTQSIAPIEISERIAIRLNRDEELVFHHALRRSSRLISRGRIAAGG